MNSGVKVLIVEDEPHALMGLAELISGWGYRTETAHDGIEGWEKAVAWNPAIVITDLKMTMNPGASAPRGAAALFALKNDTASTARFTLLGHVSKPIAPYGRGGLVVFLLRRGAFVAKIKLSARPTLRETFVIY